jgi:hypothetical protein
VLVKQRQDRSNRETMSWRSSAKTEDWTEAGGEEGVMRARKVKLVGLMGRKEASRSAAA